MPAKKPTRKNAPDTLMGMTRVTTIDLGGPGKQLAWSRHGDLLAVATSTEIRLLRTSDWSVAARLLVRNDIVARNGIAFSPAGDRIAICRRSEFGVHLTPNLIQQWRTAFAIASGRVSWSPDGRWIATGAEESGPRVFGASSARVVTLDQGQPVFEVAWSPDGTQLASGSQDGTLWSWDTQTWSVRQRINLCHKPVSALAWSPDGALLATGSEDSTLRILRADGIQVAVLEGHTSAVYHLEFTRDGRFLLSRSRFQHFVWDMQNWAIVAKLSPRLDLYFGAGSVFNPADDQLATFDKKAKLQVWRYSPGALLETTGPLPGRYLNAKVVLVGDTGVGKSGLGLVLSRQRWTETGSTHGRHVWVFGNATVEWAEGQIDTRKTLLWDLAGQPDYRLVHQLHLTDVATALIVFDSRSPTDPLAGVKYWNRALRQAIYAQGRAAIPMKKFLVAARTDVGRVGLSSERVSRIVEELGFDAYFETSAKENWGIDELRSAIAASIDWSALPIVSSNAVFEDIKQFLLAEKAEGRLLSTADDLYRSFAASRKTEDLRAEFDTCIGRLESRGLIQRLSFGDLVLLQPEIRDAYASALVSAAKDETDGLGSIREEDARTGNFRIPSEQRLTNASLENLLLISTVEDLLKHEIALREHGDDGA